MTRRVIDISHHEAPIDFTKVAGDGIVAVIAKATQGTTFIDPAYAKFKRAAASIRLPLPVRLVPRLRDEGRTVDQRRARGAVLSTNSFLWGSYHFGTGADVTVQVDHYLATAKPAANELVCLDFEENPSGTSMTLRQAKKFVSLCEERIGRYPVLYGGAWLKEQLNGKGGDLLARCPLWISQYGARPVLPPGWKKYALWQYTDGKSGPEPHIVNGVGPCDRSQYGATITQLRKAWPFSAGIGRARRRR